GAVVPPPAEVIVAGLVDDPGSPHGTAPPPGAANGIAWFDDRTALAYIARDDARGPGDAAAEATQKRVVMWWLCFGRPGYGGGSATAEQRRIAWEAVPFAGGRPGMTVPRILAHLLDARKDVRATLAMTQADSLYRSLGWLFASGLAEHGLQDLVDDALQAWLA